MGCLEGLELGFENGCFDGCAVGCLEGLELGFENGCFEGCLVGCLDGVEVGCEVGNVFVKAYKVPEYPVIYITPFPNTGDDTKVSVFIGLFVFQYKLPHGWNAYIFPFVEPM